MKNALTLTSLSLLLGLSACVQHHQLVSFPAKTSPFPATEALLNNIELRAQAHDLLRISVHSFNPEAAAPFSLDPLGAQQNQQMMIQQQGGGNQGNYGMELFNGYMVDPEGYINFPVLGRLKVGGLTLGQIDTLVTTATQPYLKDAVVNVRFLNLKITVLGEVGNPGIVRISNPRINLLEALGNAGDFTPYANRTNVLLIREENGQRTYQRLNFQAADLFRSPYFYLRQNDILYVEPLQAKVATVADPVQRAVSYGSGVLSIVTLLLAIFR
jgi:polysaccharide export outer membrane protein